MHIAQAHYLKASHAPLPTHTERHSHVVVTCIGNVQVPWIRQWQNEVESERRERVFQQEGN